MQKQFIIESIKVCGSPGEKCIVNGKELQVGGPVKAREVLVVA
jgi:hypothetical protein